MEKRTEYSKTFRNPDGTLTEEISGKPRHFKTSDGWEEIDNKLERGANGRLKNRRNSYGATFDETTPKVELAAAEGTIAMLPKGGKSARAQVGKDGHSVVYPDVWEGADLRYTLLENGFKEEIILRERPTTSEFSFTVEGANLVAQPDGGLSPDGNLRGSWYVSPPVVFGKSNEVLEGAKPRYRVAGNTVTFQVDPSWLASLRDDQFPIVLDPSWWQGGGHGRGFYNYTGAATPYDVCDPCQVRVGKPGTGSGPSWRTVVRFPYEQAGNNAGIYGTQILSVRTHLQVLDTGSEAANYPITIWGDDLNGTFGGVANWANLGAYLGTETAGNSFEMSNEFLRSYYQEIADRRLPFMALKFTGDESSAARTYKSFIWYTLTIDYNARPSMAIPLVPGNGGDIQTTTPVLEVSASDTDDQVEYFFKICTNADAETGTCHNSGWRFGSTWTTPSLTQNQTWYWHVYTRDANGQTNPNWVWSLRPVLPPVEYIRAEALDAPIEYGGQTPRPGFRPLVSSDRQELLEGGIRPLGAYTGNGNELPLVEILTGSPGGVYRATLSDDDAALAQDCNGNQDAKRVAGWVRNHMRWCQSLIGYLVKRNDKGAETGRLAWDHVTLGRGSNNGRKVFWTISMTRFRVISGTWTGQEPLTITMRCFDMDAPANLGHCQGPSDPQFTNSYTAPVSDWMANGSAYFEFNSPTTGTQSPDYFSKHRFQQEFSSIHGGQGPNAENTFRCDSSSYLPNPGSGGCVFDNVDPLFELSAKAGAPAEDVARHIYTAQHHPEQTKPQKTGKVIFGRPGSGLRLQRERSQTVQDQHRAFAQQTCNNTGENLPGKECDEYPFAATKQGANSNNNFSVKAVTPSHNHSEGGQRSGWYDSMRINDIDYWYVLITDVPTGAKAASFSDSWPEGDQPTWTSFKWTTTSNNSTRETAVANSWGRLSVNGSSAGGTAEMAPTVDSDVTFTYRFGDRGPRSFLRAMVRASGGSKTSLMPDGYRVELRSDSPTIKLHSRVAGTATQIGSFTFTQDTNPQRLRIQTVGNRIRVRAWPVGSAEPTWWPIDVIDSSISGAGVFQVFHNYDTGSHTVTIDDLQYFDITGTDPPPPPPLFNDDWSGINGQSWQTAKWAATTNDSTRKVDIQSNRGRLYVNGASARATAQMTAMTDFDLAFNYQFDNRGAKSYFRPMVRASGAGGTTQRPTGYRLEISSDSATIKLQSVVNDVVTDLGSFTEAMDTNRHWIRFQVIGTTIRAKAWVDGTPEPTSWAVEMTDSSVSTSGVIQLTHIHSSGSHAITLDDLALR